MSNNRLKDITIRGKRLNELPQLPILDTVEMQGDLKDLPKVNYEKLVRTHLKHGIFLPFYVWESPEGINYIADGHQRRRVLPAEGYTGNVPVVYIEARDRQDAKEKLLVISSQYGRITQEGFDEFTFDLPDIGELVHFDALAFEFATDEDDPTEQGDAEPQIDRAAELQEKWGTERGQLWAIGEHRLLCGDSTVREDVERVTGGDKARLVATSPPYNNQREYEIGEFDWQKLARGVSDNVFSVLDAPGDFLCNLGLEYYQGKLNPYWNEWLEYCHSIGHDLYGWYVWDKGSGFPGEWNGRLAPSHEWVFHFSNGRQSANKWVETIGRKEIDGKRFRQKDGSLRELTSPDKVGQSHKIPDSVIRINREMARGIHTESHPAVYPVEFASFFVNTWSDNGDIVYEPFAGSGTTLVACQNLSRRGRAIEISPAYCAVILQRMADAFPGIDIYKMS